MIPFLSGVLLIAGNIELCEELNVTGSTACLLPRTVGTLSECISYRMSW